MRILVAHSRYRYPGGEETVFEQETALLREAGHEVIVHDRSNWETTEFPLLKKVTLPKRVIWAEDARRQMRALLRETQPDIAHFHNLHYMLSPSVFWACREAHVPVVHSLHNPRLMCPSSTLFRDGRLCEDCVGKNPPWPSVLHGCYRDSRLQTAVMAGMLVFHRWRQTWSTMVDTLIVFTEFFRRKFIEIGLPADKIALKPHFVSPDPGPRVFDPASPGNYALYLGRLDVEKGTYPLLRAWEALAMPLKIRGGGPLLAEVEQIASRSPQIEIVGRLERDALFDLIKGARFLIWPSVGYYETFGMVAIEAFACGVPVIGSRIGVGEEIVTDQQTGLHFEAGNADDLAAKVRWAWDHPAAMVELGQNARRTFEEKYSAARNLALLTAIYQQTIDRYASSRP
ncbi:MAG: glycosyltransferase family 4 protein [Anaerolineae bacterium]|nr:glycosyltransferase family 4 protein [Anaerolineae bacterium]